MKQTTRGAAPGSGPLAHILGTVTVERAVLRLVGDIYGLLEIEEFRAGLLSALLVAVPADAVSLNEIGLDGSIIFTLTEPPLEERWHKAWGRFGLQNPILDSFARTGSGLPLRFSDLVSVEELHALDLYRELYGPLGLEHQIAFTLPARSGVILGVALSRSGHDFSDEERDLLAIARPHLIQAYNNARQHSTLLQAKSEHHEAELAPSIELLRSLGLTARESEVLSLLAMHRSDREIAGELAVSPRTVEKHLQRCYAKLGVGDRRQARSLLSELRKKPQPASPG
jgi:DNA-binding CsgD family transcriptional regulator